MDLDYYLQTLFISPLFLETSRTTFTIDDGSFFFNLD